jgi:hypothetical protein
MTYRADPVTQRDGSSLANSNCRMAAGATVIDYDTLGSVTSSGSAMRARQSDQSGGTDSGDLSQAWASYGESLGIRDGYAWSDAMADLRAGRAIVLDVWHAAAGGPCVSGSGAYGHSIAVAPEFHSDGDRVLTCDPWCSPARWDWWAIQKLEHGASVWADQVYGRSTGGPIAGLVRELMTRWRPGREASPADVLDTGGAGRILYSRSAAHAAEVDPMGLILDHVSSWAGEVTLTTAGASAIVVADKSLVALPSGTVKRGVVRAQLGEAYGAWPAGTPVVGIGDELAVFIEAQCELEPDPPPSSGGDYADGWNEARANVVDALETWALEVLPPR